MAFEDTQTALKLSGSNLVSGSLRPPPRWLRSHLRPSNQVIAVRYHGLLLEGVHGVLGASLSHAVRLHLLCRDLIGLHSSDKARIRLCAQCQCVPAGRKHLSVKVFERQDVQTVACLVFRMRPGKVTQTAVI